MESTQDAILDLVDNRGLIRPPDLDVLKEGLREQGRRGGRPGRRANIDEIWRHAQLDRVTNVMRP